MQKATEELLSTHDALDLIDGLFIPTLDEVGIRFDKGSFFLPQLMASAEAVKVGFDVVKAHMAANGATEQTEDKPIILATVKGDIHDIGKNIVKMLLENYGFRVVDLGRDVDPQTVVDAAKEQNIRLVGLSALMTTTVRKPSSFCANKYPMPKRSWAVPCSHPNTLTPWEQPGMQKTQPKARA